MKECKQVPVNINCESFYHHIRRQWRIWGRKECSTAQNLFIFMHFRENSRLAPKGLTPPLGNPAYSTGNGSKTSSLQTSHNVILQYEWLQGVSPCSSEDGQVHVSVSVADPGFPRRGGRQLPRWG